MKVRFFAIIYFYIQFFNLYSSTYIILHKRNSTSDISESKLCEFLIIHIIIKIVLMKNIWAFSISKVPRSKTK